MFGANLMYSPKINQLMRISLLAGSSYTDHTFLPSFGINVESFFGVSQAIVASLMVQPTVAYLHQSPDCKEADGVLHCQNNLSDNRDQLSVINLGLGYQYYFDHDRWRQGGQSATASGRVHHYVGGGTGQTVAHYPSNYDANAAVIRPWEFDTVDVSLLHGLRFSPYYSLEFSGHYLTERGDELRKKHFSFWSFAHRLSLPSLQKNSFVGYGKLGSFYSNDRRGD